MNFKITKTMCNTKEKGNGNNRISLLTKFNLKCFCRAKFDFYGIMLLSIVFIKYYKAFSQISFNRDFTFDVASSITILKNLNFPIAYFMYLLTNLH